MIKTRMVPLITAMALAVAYDLQEVKIKNSYLELFKSI